MGALRLRLFDDAPGFAVTTRGALATARIWSSVQMSSQALSSLILSTRGKRNVYPTSGYSCEVGSSAHLISRTTDLAMSLMMRSGRLSVLGFQYFASHAGRLPRSYLRFPLISAALGGICGCRPLEVRRRARRPVGMRRAVLLKSADGRDSVVARLEVVAELLVDVFDFREAVARAHAARCVVETGPRVVDRHGELRELALAPAGRRVGPVRAHDDHV